MMNSSVWILEEPPVGAEVHLPSSMNTGLVVNVVSKWGNREAVRTRRSTHELQGKGIARGARLTPLAPVNSLPFNTQANR